MLFRKTLSFLSVIVSFLTSLDLSATKPVCPDEYDKNRALLPCCRVPEGFYTCTILDCKDDQSLSLTVGSKQINCSVGCNRFGGASWSPADNSTALCTVLDGVPCTGDTTFLYEDYPCIRYKGFYFTTAILLSVFVGVLGADRMYLGNCGVGFLKLCTLGGVGLWWFADIILLITGQLQPPDGSSWEESF